MKSIFKLKRSPRVTPSDVKPARSHNIHGHSEESYWQDRSYDEPSTFNVLAFDGGGSKGVMEAFMLQDIMDLANMIISEEERHHKAMKTLFTKDLECRLDWRDVRENLREVLDRNRPSYESKRRRKTFKEIAEGTLLMFRSQHPSPPSSSKRSQNLYRQELHPTHAFDLVAGTSTGALIAFALVHAVTRRALLRQEPLSRKWWRFFVFWRVFEEWGDCMEWRKELRKTDKRKAKKDSPSIPVPMQVHEVVELYTKKVDKIFRKKFILRYHPKALFYGFVIKRFSPELNALPYSTKGLTVLLRETFGENLTLGDISKTKESCGAGAVARRVDGKNQPDAPMMFSTLQSEHRKAKLHDVLKASTCAPIYFPTPVQIHGVRGDFVDGGVGANCPVGLAIEKLQKVYPNRKPGLVLSLAPPPMQETTKILDRQQKPHEQIKFWLGYFPKAMTDGNADYEKAVSANPDGIFLRISLSSPKARFACSRLKLDSLDITRMINLVREESRDYPVYFEKVLLAAALVVVEFLSRSNTGARDGVKMPAHVTGLMLCIAHLAGQRHEYVIQNHLLSAITSSGINLDSVEKKLRFLAMQAEVQEKHLGNQAECEKTWQRVRELVQQNSSGSNSLLLQLFKIPLARFEGDVGPNELSSLERLLEGQTDDLPYSFLEDFASCCEEAGDFNRAITWYHKCNERLIELDGDPERTSNGQFITKIVRNRCRMALCRQRSKQQVERSQYRRECQDAFKKADRLIRESLEGEGKDENEKQLATSELFRAVGNFHRREGDAAEAVWAFEHAYASLRRASAGSTSHSEAALLCDAAAALGAAGFVSRAAETQEEAVKARRIVHGQRAANFTLAKALEGLGDFNVEKGSFDLALDSFVDCREMLQRIYRWPGDPNRMLQVFAAHLRGEQWRDKPSKRMKGFMTLIRVLNKVASCQIHLNEMGKAQTALELSQAMLTRAYSEIPDVEYHEKLEESLTRCLVLIVKLGPVGYEPFPTMPGCPQKHMMRKLGHQVATHQVEDMENALEMMRMFRSICRYEFQNSLWRQKTEGWDVIKAEDLEKFLLRHFSGVARQSRVGSLSLQKSKVWVGDVYRAQRDFENARNILNEALLRLKELLKAATEEHETVEKDLKDLMKKQKREAQEAEKAVKETKKSLTPSQQQRELQMKLELAERATILNSLTGNHDYERASSEGEVKRLKSRLRSVERETTKIDRARAAALWSLGWTHLARFNMDWAEQSMEEAMDYCSAFEMTSRGHFNLGQCCQERGEGKHYRKAVRHYTKALDLLDNGLSGNRDEERALLLMGLADCRLKVLQKSWWEFGLDGDADRDAERALARRELRESLQLWQRLSRRVWEHHPTESFRRWAADATSGGEGAPGLFRSLREARAEFARWNARRIAEALDDDFADEGVSPVKHDLLFSSPEWVSFGHEV